MCACVGEGQNQLAGGAVEVQQNPVVFNVAVAKAGQIARKRVVSVSLEQKVVQLRGIIAEFGVGGLHFRLGLVVRGEHLLPLRVARELEGNAADIADLLHEAIEGGREIHADIVEDILDLGLEFRIGAKGNGCGCVHW